MIAAGIPATNARAMKMPEPSLRLRISVKIQIESKMLHTIQTRNANLSVSRYEDGD